MNNISIDEQRAAGLTRPQANYVPALPATVRREMPMPIETNVAHVIDAPLSSVQHVEMRTSAVDRAKGFLIASVPLYAGFATAVAGVCVVGWSVPLFSLASFLIFWLSFIGAWIIGYCYTLSVSAEGVSLFEARSKWSVIKEEQRRRWAHYERQIGSDNE
jgi:hypothetical protein